jgi:hypothetical protein
MADKILKREVYKKHID